MVTFYMARRDKENLVSRAVSRYRVLLEINNASTHHALFSASLEAYLLLLKRVLDGNQ
jgi:hypothetical protein